MQAEGTPCREPRRTDGGGNEREERRKSKRSRGGGLSKPEPASVTNGRRFNRLWSYISWSVSSGWSRNRQERDGKSLFCSTSAGHTSWTRKVVCAKSSTGFPLFFLSGFFPLRRPKISWLAALTTPRGRDPSDASVGALMGLADAKRKRKLQADRPQRVAAGQAGLQ